MFFIIWKSNWKEPLFDKSKRSATIDPSFPAVCREAFRDFLLEFWYIILNDNNREILRAVLDLKKWKAKRVQQGASHSPQALFEMLITEGGIQRTPAAFYWGQLPSWNSDFLKLEKSSYYLRGLAGTTRWNSSHYINFETSFRFYLVETSCEANHSILRRWGVFN